MLKKVVALIFLISFLTALGASASVGTAPGSINLGELEPGESVEKDVYITTNFNDEFIVQPSLTSGVRSSHFEEEHGDEISQKDIGDWVEVQEEAEVDPNITTTYELDNGNSVNANGFFTFELNVPTSAEPGYHYGSFRLNPEISSDGQERTVNWGETRPNFVFRVSGQAERSIDIIDIEGVRIGDEDVQIIKQVRNSGTVTTRLSGGEFSVLDQDSREIDSMNISSATLAPGEVAEIDTTWSSENVEGGNYQVEGLGDYTTGEAHISGDFAITDVIREPVDIDEPDAETEEDSDIPYTLLLMILLFLGVMLYLLEIDLVWTIIFVGVTGISLFILFSSAPMYLILILAALIGVILYYGI